MLRGLEENLRSRVRIPRSEQLELSRRLLQPAGPGSGIVFDSPTDYLDYGYKLATLSGERLPGIANCRESVTRFQRLAQNGCGREAIADRRLSLRTHRRNPAVG